MTTLVMFDIDGTLVDSYDLDGACYIKAIKKVLKRDIDDQWHTHPHVTDEGIANFLLQSMPGQEDDKTKLKGDIQRTFFNELRQSLCMQPIMEIAGANRFLQQLNSSRHIELAIATGGWRRSAQMKLASAGIDFSQFTIASADDHYDRCQIMQHAAARFPHVNHIVYFGDGAWDAKASALLGYDFIAVGERSGVTPYIENYVNLEPFSWMDCGDSLV